MREALAFHDIGKYIICELRLQMNIVVPPKNSQRVNVNELKWLVRNAHSWYCQYNRAIHLVIADIRLGNYLGIPRILRNNAER